MKMVIIYHVLHRNMLILCKDLNQITTPQEGSIGETASLHNASSSPLRQFISKRTNNVDESSDSGTGNESMDSSIIRDPKSAAAAFLAMRRSLPECELKHTVNSKTEDNSDGSSDKSVSEIIPVAAAAAFLARRQCHTEQVSLPTVESFTEDKSDGSSDTSSLEIHPVAVAAEFLARKRPAEKAITAPEVSDNEDSKSDSSFFRVDTKIAAAAFLSNKRLSRDEGETLQFNHSFT